MSSPDEKKVHPTNGADEEQQNSESAPMTILDYEGDDADEDDDAEFDPDEVDEGEDDEEDYDEDEDVNEDEDIDEFEEAEMEDEKAVSALEAQSSLLYDSAEAEHETRARQSFLSGAGQMANIKQLMSSEGPHCTAVLIAADGAVSELTIDMTPRKNELARILGGKIGFLGQFDQLQVVVCQRRDDSSQSLPVNQYRLPAPFDDVSARGDLILVRMDDDANPQNFTLTEWQTFLSKAGTQQQPVREAATKRTRDDDADDGESESSSNAAK